MKSYRSIFIFALTLVGGLQRASSQEVKQDVRVDWPTQQAAPSTRITDILNPPTRLKPNMKFDTPSLPPIQVDDVFNRNNQAVKNASLPSLFSRLKEGEPHFFIFPRRGELNIGFIYRNSFTLQ